MRGKFWLVTFWCPACSKLCVTKSHRDSQLLEDGRENRICFRREVLYFARPVEIISSSKLLEVAGSYDRLVLERTCMVNKSGR